MISSAKLRFRLLIVVSAGLLGGAGIALYSVVWRHATYHSIGDLIDSSRDADAARAIKQASKTRWFEADWPPQGAMPSWRSLHKLDQELFGCPTCRGHGRRLLGSAARWAQKEALKALLES